jgi:hypothetical protein
MVMPDRRGYNASEGLMFRILGIGLLLAAAIWAGKPKNTGPFKNENQDVSVSATVILDKEEIKQLLGSDLDGHYILVNVTVTPKFGKELDVRRDDFILRTDKDGERSSPYVGSQIAGKGALVVTQTAGQGTSGGPQFGSPYDVPYYGGGIGGGPSQITEAQGKINGSAKGDDPLVKALNEKMLQEKKTEAPVSGLLYFPMEKQKQKDLELYYNTPDGKLSIRFR